ncbi:MAG: EF-Tu/IF-2/RF-3 family GTPase, partial [bacterium]
QMRVSNVTGDSFKGRIAIGRVGNGVLRQGAEVAHIARDGRIARYRVMALMTFTGLERAEVEEVRAGDLAAVAGIPDIGIGETIADPAEPVALPLLDVEQPTVKMTFSVNDSPFAGREGEYSTSRQIRARLFKELETDMALRVEDTGEGAWVVSGRGELHLAILIERMRREGFEFQVSRPQVITKQVNGATWTPFERLVVEVPEASQGIVMQKLGGRAAELVELRIEKGVAFMEFVIPTRGLFGYRSEFVIDTRGQGLINATFLDYRADPGKWKERDRGSLVAFETGETVMFGLLKVQDRGTLFLGPGIPVYKGQVVGQNSRGDDIRVNVCKAKVLTNMRSKGDGVTDHHNAPRLMTLEESLEYIADDELVEVTPKTVRIRKAILDESEWRKQKIHGIKA